MNTNINDSPNFLDVTVLQNLANQFFKALPEDVPKEFSLDPTEHPKAQGLAEQLLGTLNTPTTQNPLENPLLEGTNLPSLGGFGGSILSISPNIDSNFGTTTPNTSLDKNVPYTSGIPSSVAGSGVSPSYISQGNSFNKENPETSFHDDDIGGNQQTSTNFQDTQHHVDFSFLNELTHFLEVDKLLSHIKVTESKPQLHLYQEVTNPSRFYFLENSAYKQKIEYSSFGNLGELVRKDFPILNEQVNGKRLVWFDNAATTQKPQIVIDRLSHFYKHENSNIHRAAHELAGRATDAYEAAREKVRSFLGAKSVNEIIFVRGATEAINLVAQSWGNQNLVAGDEIIVSHLEHHANIVPWKRLADTKGLILKVIPVNDDGELLIDEYAKLLSSRTKLVAVTQVSNALGTVTPVQQIVAMAHAVGAKALIDGAQSVSHMTVNVQAIDADFFVFSGHKVFAPTGIGVLYGKEEILNATEPWQGGGNMIQDVTFEHIKYHYAPNRFEAGTGNIADAVGLGAAIDYVSKIGMEVIGQYEHALLEYATNLLRPINGVRLIGTAKHKASVLPFTLKGYTNDEVGKALNQEGIAVRTGHHCAQPILRRLGVETTVRPSLAFYNTCEDVDRFIAVIQHLSLHKQ